MRKRKDMEGKRSHHTHRFGWLKRWEIIRIGEDELTYFVSLPFSPSPIFLPFSTGVLLFVNLSSISPSSSFLCCVESYTSSHFWWYGSLVFIFLMHAVYPNKIMRKLSCFLFYSYLAMRRGCKMDACFWPQKDINHHQSVEASQLWCESWWLKFDQFSLSSVLGSFPIWIPILVKKRRGGCSSG